MTVRDVDVEYAFDDPDDGWFGRAEVAAPEPRTPRDVDDTTDPLDADSADTDRWYVPAADPRPVVRVDDVPRDAVPERSAGPTIASQLDFTPTRRKSSVAAPPRKPRAARLSGKRAREVGFTPMSGPRRRPRYALLAGIAAAAVAVIGVVLMVRSPAPAVDEPTTVAPSESTAQPAPTSAAPVLSTQVPVPPPPPGVPPPPPAPSAEEISPPPVDRQSAPSYQTPDAPKKPQLDVTRAPMSATPPPPPKPDRNSSTPGDAKPRRGFF